MKYEWSKDEEKLKRLLKKYYSPEEVAESVGVSRRSVYDWLTSGRLKGTRAGRRWAVSEEAIQAFMKASEQAAKKSKTVTEQPVESPGPSQVKKVYKTGQFKK